MTLLIIFLALLALDALRRAHRNTIVTRHRFRLYALRDDLREAVMRGEVQDTNWVFQYLDSSIAKTISALEHMSLWRNISMFLFTRNDQKTLASLQHLWGELRKPENKVLDRVYLHYLAELGFFFSCRHAMLKLALMSVVRGVRAQRWIKDKTKQLRQVLTASPETSTLFEFVHS